MRPPPLSVRRLRGLKRSVHSHLLGQPQSDGLGSTLPIENDEALFTEDETENKHTGAKGGQKGYDFQDLVSIIRVLRLITEKNWMNLDRFYVRANAAASQVDDLHIWVDAKRMHIQIKSDPSVTWEKKLRKEFSHDKGAYRQTKFELWVTSKRNKDSLDDNKGKHKLKFVVVDYVDIEYQKAPYRHEVAVKKLNWLCLPSDEKSFHHGIWNNIEGVWRRLTERDCTVERLLLEASKASGYVIKIPPKHPAKMTELINVLRDKLPAFEFSAAGRTLLYRYRHLEGMAPLHTDVEMVIDELISSPPTTEKEFLQRMGGKQSGK